MELLEPRDRALFLGKTGSGKSRKAKQLLALHQQRRGARIVAFDPHDEYSRQGKASEYIDLGPLKHRVTVDELALNPERWLDAEDVSLAVVPDTQGGRRAVAEDFSDLCRIVGWSGDLLFCVDEVGYFGDYAEEDLEDAACQLRHQGIALALVAQRATQIPKTARAQASVIYSGRQDDPDDVNALRKIAGEDFAERVQRLAPGQLEHWRDSFKPTPEKKQ